MNNTFNSNSLIDANAKNTDEIVDFFHKLQLDTQSQRSVFLSSNNKKEQPLYVISYNSTSGGPIKNA